MMVANCRAKALLIIALLGGSHGAAATLLGEDAGMLEGTTIPVEAPQLAPTDDMPLPPRLAIEALRGLLGDDVPGLEPEQPPDLWSRIRDGFVLDRELDEPRVKAEIDWFRRHPEYVMRVSERASRHLYHIVQELEARHMPLDLALLPVVESAFDPFAYSHGRASGLWQFIPSTARLYGLKIDWWYDGRRDVVDSTRAALDYLARLHEINDGDWLLALAAYNSGQGNVNAAIRRNEKRNRGSDFWSLSVPQETSAYVPRLLAIVEIVSNPEKYGVSLHPIIDEPYWTAVDVGSQLDLARAAELAGITPDEFHRLNPGYNQWSTHPDGPHRLLLPIENTDAFETALAELSPSERVAWTRHKIRKGENLGLIARKYQTSIAAIRAVNNIRGNTIVAGDSLMIPTAGPETDYPMTSDARLARTQRGLAQRYGEPVVHTIQPGDSFWSISRQYGVGMRELAGWNGMGTSTLLQPGKTLKIFRGNPMLARPQVRKVNYRVRKGESLSLIANRFNLSVSNIEQWNAGLRNRKYIQPGDKITLYVDVTTTE